jgi:sarcosine oxidase
MARCATPADVDVDVDVVIVGNGGAGAAAAWALTQRGRSVAVFDRFPAGHEQGSSHGTERIFRYAYSEPEFVALAIEARPGWRELELLAGEQLLGPTGGIDYGNWAQLECIAAALAEYEVPFERVDRTAARARVPELSIDAGALVQPGGAVIAADRALTAFRSVARRAGANFADDESVRALHVEHDHRVVVETSRGRVARARVAIVAAGAWAAPLLSGLVALPAITVTQEQVAFFRPHNPVDGLPAFIAYDDIPVYGLGTPNGLVKIAEHGSGPVVDPDARSFAVDETRAAALVDWVARCAPGVDPKPVEWRTCLYASTADDRFVLDRVGPVVVGAGLGGHGFKFLPAIGARLADLANLEPGESIGANPFALRSPP